MEMDYYVPGSQRMSPLDTDDGVLSATVTMTLMQMVADVYEDARKEWQRNSERYMGEDDDNPELFGPNQAQLAVETWLVRAQFLPPRERLRGEILKGAVEPYNSSQTFREKYSSSTSSTKKLASWVSIPKWRARRKSAEKQFKIPLFPLALLRKRRNAYITKPTTFPITQRMRSSSLNSESTTSSTEGDSTLTKHKIVSKHPRRFSRPKRSMTTSSDITLVGEPETKPDDPSPSYDTETCLYTPYTEALARIRPIISDVPVTLLPQRQDRSLNPEANFSFDIGAELCPVPNPDEVTIWTLLGITCLGYFCFFVLFLACTCIGLKRLACRASAIFVQCAIEEEEDSG